MQVKDLRFFLIVVCMIGISIFFTVCANAFESAQTDRPSDTSSSNVSSTQTLDSVNAMNDIIDIKPVEKIGFDTRMLRYLTYALASLAIVIILMYCMDRIIRKRKKNHRKNEVKLPPDRVAIQNLNDLEAQTDLEEKEYYFRLTAIVRHYIKGRFSMDAPEMTTEELLPKIHSLPLDKNLAAQLKDLLKTTDPIKFAGTSAGSEKIKNDMTFARMFIESTRKVQEENTPKGNPV